MLLFPEDLRRLGSSREYSDSTFWRKTILRQILAKLSMKPSRPVVLCKHDRKLGHLSAYNSVPLCPTEEVFSAEDTAQVMLMTQKTFRTIISGIQ